MITLKVAWTLLKILLGSAAFVSIVTVVGSRLIGKRGV
jgi:hypothetical protein